MDKTRVVAGFVVEARGVLKGHRTAEYTVFGDGISIADAIAKARRKGAHFFRADRPMAGLLYEGVLGEAYTRDDGVVVTHFACGYGMKPTRSLTDDEINARGA